MLITSPVTAARISVIAPPIKPAVLVPALTEGHISAASFF